MAVVVAMSRSKSLASLRLRPSQAKVRSITQPLLRLQSRRDRGRSAPAGGAARGESLGMAGALDDLEPQRSRAAACRRFALVGGIGKQVLEPGKAPANSGADQPEAVTVLHAGGMDDPSQRQARRIGEEMTLAPIDLLAGVEPAWAAGFRRLDALTVDDRRRRLDLAPGPLPRCHEQGGLDRRPDALLPEPPEVAVDRAARREPTRQHPPYWAGRLFVAGGEGGGEGGARGGSRFAAGTAKRSASRAAPSSAAGRHAWPAGSDGSISANSASVTSVASRPPERRCRWRAGTSTSVMAPRSRPNKDVTTC